MESLDDKHAAVNTLDSAFRSDDPLASHTQSVNPSPASQSGIHYVCVCVRVRHRLYTKNNCSLFWYVPQLMETPISADFRRHAMCESAGATP